jgi:hypothetical protein
MPEGTNGEDSFGNRNAGAIQYLRGLLGAIRERHTMAKDRVGICRAR